MGKAEGFKDLGGDFNDGFLLEYLTVAGVVEERQPGLDFSVVVAGSLHDLFGFEFMHIAVEVILRAAAVGIDRNSGGFTQYVFGVNGGIVGNQLQGEIERQPDFSRQWLCGQQRFHMDLYA